MGFSICYFLGVTEPPERETAGKWGLLNADVTKCLAPVWLTSITLFFFLVMRTSEIYSLSNFQYTAQYHSVQFSRSVMSDSLRPHELQHARPPYPSPTPGVHSNSRCESVMPSSHLILCYPLLLLSAIPPSIRVFSNKSTLRMRWPKYWSFSFNISPSNEHQGLISFMMG